MKKKILSTVLIILFLLALLISPFLYQPNIENGLPSETVTTDEIVVGAALLFLTILIPVFLQNKRWRPGPDH